jgi:hypothetical protein
MTNIFKILLYEKYETVRSAFVARALYEQGKKERMKRFLATRGARGEIVFPDKLRFEFGHGEEAIGTPVTKSVIGTESLSQMICQKCGDALQHTTVCPKCAAGKLGYRHRYTCVCGGTDFISREIL